ncbi:50S ribosomal protein L29 [Moheibacter sp. BDHS18]|uniref:Large ribosomal subunit protein uL29 n=2 Tax=Moheibacter lacus TaxID=2745851 RepID=A0A838ZSU6_9FLAO|nr:50S ribosomal protein L29 [Moheibacter lacus]
MKISDMNEMSVEDIKAQIAQEKDNYAKLKVSHKVSQLESPLSIRASRKTIARLSTVLNQKLAQQ